MNWNVLWWELLKLTSALFLIVIALFLLAIVPMHPGNELMVMRLDSTPATVWCENGRLYHNRFVERGGRPRYAQVPIGRAMIVYLENMPVVLLCTA
ncbi:hypothetical protein C4556_03690 [Candidatus Parcubacteria bacterium]|nr:MAG: hypothetical protein C4556_03690 [Candidatus Parcubacteria bacterium]